MSNETNSSWGGFGVTLFDALDTMLLMGLNSEYQQAKDHVLSVDFKKVNFNVFFIFILNVRTLLIKY